MAGQTHRTFDRRPMQHISLATWHFMRERIAHLEAEVYRLTLDRDHWYMAANYTPDEIREFTRRRLMNLDENGEYKWPPTL